MTLEQIDALGNDPARLRRHLRGMAHERDALAADRNSVAAHRDAAVAQRDAIHVEREALLVRAVQAESERESSRWRT